LDDRSEFECEKLHTEDHRMQDLLRELHLQNAPVLQISEADAPVYNTGYIDFIKPSMMENNVFMQGTDWYGRKFVSVQYQCIQNKKWYTQVGTIFERYSDSDKVICFGGPLLLHTDSYVSDLPGLIIKLKKLQSGAFVDSDTTSLARLICLSSCQKVIVDVLHQVLHPHLVHLVKVCIWGKRAKEV